MKLIKRVFTACITIAMCIVNIHCTHKKDKHVSASKQHAVENDSDFYAGIYLIPDGIVY